MVFRSPFALRTLLPGALALLVAMPLAGARAVAADWPTYGHDIGRSGTTSETVRVPLVRAWRVRSPSRPVPVWDEPATWDGWNRVMRLRNRVEFDKAFQVAAVGDLVYYGSSVDDKLYCLDAATGKTRWTFFAEGPIRLAPTVAHDRVYFGSDDGCVYCLKAGDGALVWKRRLAPHDRRLPGNGRMISLWPVRTGVTVAGDAVYCGAGVLPSETVYLGALAADDGSLVWRTALDDLPLQGYPLVSNRYLFVQGNRVLFGMDAYNGTVLWTLQIPTLRRANMPRDGSNMVAADDQLYLAMGPFCVGLDPASGRPVRRFRVASSEAARQWGYLACVDDLLVGSAVKKGSQYLGDDGQWYEDFGDANVARVTSDRLFAIDRRDGTARWSYDGGIVINSTITIANGRIWFVESTNPAAAAAASGRLYAEVQKDQQLVAIALDSGKVLWRTPFDFSRCQFMIYGCYGADTVIVTGTDQQKVFHTYAFTAERGKFLWQHEAAAQKRHHSGHLGHPVLVDGKLYGNRMVLDVATGKVLRQDLLERRGCGTMAGSGRALFYRHYYHGTWDLQTDVRREYAGVRTNCWLGTIPAGGLLLLPESAAGCSCDGAIQTSMAMAPHAGAAAE